jgi:hypothetical protein
MRPHGGTGACSHLEIFTAIRFHQVRAADRLMTQAVRKCDGRTGMMIYGFTEVSGE